MLEEKKEIENVEAIEPIEIVSTDAYADTDTNANVDTNTLDMPVLDGSDTSSDTPIPEIEDEKKKKRQYNKKAKVIDSVDFEFENIKNNIQNSQEYVDEPENEKKPLFEKKHRGKKGEKIENSFVIEGYILLMLVDMVMPLALSFIINLIAKKNLTVDEIQLDEKAMKRLEPLADSCAKQLSINMSPITGFLIVSSLLYAQNVTIAISKHK